MAVKLKAEGNGGEADSALDSKFLGHSANSDMPEIEKKFWLLCRQWQKDTEHFSSASRMAKHPAYREIVSMKEDVLPILLEQLKRDPDDWFIALHEITGENPVPQKSAGNIKEMAKAWIKWGKEKGIIK